MLNQLMLMGTYAKLRFGKWFSDEKGGNEIVMAVVLMGIGVLLAIVFKDKVIQLLETLFAKVSSNAQSAIDGK